MMPMGQESGNQPVFPPAAPPIRPRSKRFRAAVVAGAFLLVAFLGGGIYAAITLAGHHTSSQPEIASLPQLPASKLALQGVLVNGQLLVNNGIVLKPSAQPTAPALG